MEITAAKDKSGKAGVEIIPFDYVLFLEWSAGIKRIIVHTVWGRKFYLTGPFKFWSQALVKSHGDTFYEVDRYNLVNAKNVKWIDTGSYKRIGFDDKLYCL
ncbi:hypothetical protein [Paenibacillus sp. 453mf]|uniref:hypothetical protein n=1 Tax=Paenibacillus sp. 453mf TaxID=1761874 RepID=UPI0008EBFB09|nr:hypothetical protein [Paenibacillus sp. 453mf]SFS60988.1 hypothetical protein SAMN04488601_1012541 [Paenibacillus sp. 453mf]